MQADADQEPVATTFCNLPNSVSSFDLRVHMPSGAFHVYMTPGVSQSKVYSALENLTKNHGVIISVAPYSVWKTNRDLEIEFINKKTKENAELFVLIKPHQLIKL